MKQLLRDRLLAAAPVSEICGDRIHWGLSPQGLAFPRVRLSLISAPRSYHLTGEGGLYFAQVQVDCFAEDYLKASELSDAIANDLSAQRWDRIRLITVNNQRDGNHELGPPVIFHIMNDLQVIYKGA